ncbi:MAG TPA: hypothetical protein VJN96_21305 [Vicinamibacterales bacterium]|nr:hypothetical protein [Vicinamibacterales bacterium]
MSSGAFRLDRAPVVVGAYIVLAVVMTWPLSLHLKRFIAWDLGDPAFICWVMMWTGGQVLKLLHGDVNALHDYWNGNIFSPERLTIAYSEHFTPQMLQALPIFAATGNMVLCYNLLFLSTIVLAGWGMYLLVRELTGRPLAAFVAGLAFAFAPYRISEGSHLQVLSSQWMPLALYGFRRYFVTGRTRPLVGASTALTIQNLSCGYYLLFFAPFAGAYCLYEMADRRLLRNARVWASLTIAAVAVAAITWPFVSPYLKVRRHGEGVRSVQESVEFSADIYAFGTASTKSIEGDVVAAFPKGEGEGFMGFAILALAGVAVVWGIGRARAEARAPSAPVPWRRIAGAIVGVTLVLDLVVSIVLMLAGSLPIVVNGRPFHDVAPLLVAAVALGALLLVISPRARRFVRGVAGSTLGFYASATLAAAMLALGPRIMSFGRPVGFGPYYWLFRYVPGFDGIRVPSRYLMLVACFLAVLAGVGVAALLARLSRRAGIALVTGASLLILAESWVVPMPTNVRLVSRGYELSPRELYTGQEMGPLYQYVRDAPGDVTLIEFPFGDPAYEILATYYAGYHRRPLVNGYSGFYPESYLRRATFLDHIPFDLETAYKAVQSSGATHAIVHEAAFENGRGHEMTDWLVANGARVIATYGSDRLLQLK